jgi:hypothetical protein
VPEFSKRLLELFDTKAQENAALDDAARVDAKVGEYHGFTDKHPDLFNWVCDRADAHVDIDANLLESAAECNTFKKIRNRILDLQEQAKRVRGE